jgi:hypothetical protein
VIVYGVYDDSNDERRIHSELLKNAVFDYWTTLGFDLTFNIHIFTTNLIHKEFYKDKNIDPLDNVDEEDETKQKVFPRENAMSIVPENEEFNTENAFTWLEEYEKNLIKKDPTLEKVQKIQATKRMR